MTFKGHPIPTLTISLPDPLGEFIEQQVKAKGFGDTGEYLSSLVKNDQQAETENHLDRLLLDGLVSPESDDIEATPEFWNDLKTDAGAS